MESHKSHTKDEKFIISLYQAASKAGEIDTPFDRYELGIKAGLTHKGTDAVCKLLLQANFIKKSGEALVYMTPHGENLALRLLEE
jgi:hypothetical protein